MKKLSKIGSILLAGYLLFWVLSLPGQNEQKTAVTTTSQRSPFAQSNPDNQTENAQIVVGDPVIPTLSQPARDLPLTEIEIFLDREINPRLNLNGNPIAPSDSGLPNGRDSLLEQQANAAPYAPNAFLTPILNFTAQDYTFVNPPDTVGDVGPNHYVHMINTGGGSSVVIYNKSGGVLAGPFNLNSLGSGSCATGLGDPVVLYDQAANRWLLTEFSGSGNVLCVYVSTTPDPTGTYYNYAFTTPNFPDYPKYGIWSDAYYVSSNENSPAVYALDRTKMIAGQAATSLRFTATTLSGFDFQALTPSNWEGSTPPPAGAPNYFMRHRDTEVHGPTGYPSEDFLEIWAFHADFITPANATFSQIASVSVAEFDSSLCGLTSFYCFPQLGSATTLDPLREVVMFPLTYRNFGSYQALVGNLVTDVDGTDHGGVRWFELRKVGAGAWTLYQQGTLAPDAHSRWMGSIGMDGSGNIAVGYSVSSSSMYPSIRYAGRLASDPLGTLPYVEGSMIAGTSANGSNRWGDYSAMGLDPADDCTFWYTNMFAEGGNWNTRVASFKFDQCGTADFTLTAVPDSQAICVGTDATYDITIGQVQSFPDPVTLSASGFPGGTTANFSVNPVTPPGSSQLTIGNTAVASSGSYTIEISGIAPTSTHTTTVALDVFTGLPGTAVLQTPANAAINVSSQPTFTWTGSAASYIIEIATDAGFTNIIDSATTSATTYTTGLTLNTSSLYYWRVRASNACGDGANSSIFRFTTQAAAGDCGPGSSPNILASEGFESGAGGWTHSGTGDTWTLSTARPHTGSYSFKATNPASVSDQRLVSPPIILPTGESPLSLQFWNHQTIERGTSICYDGAVLEISTNGGSTWTDLEPSLLTDPYDMTVSSSYSNPLAGRKAWCGDPQDWLNSIVSLDDYAGQTVQFRFRLGSDTSVGREGWYIDDVKVQSCSPSVGYDAAFDPATSQYGLPGQQSVHELILRNTGVGDDAYDLLLSDYIWPTTLLTTSPITLTAGMSATVSVAVTVPEHVSGQDSFILTAVSHASPGLAPTVTTFTELLQIYLPYVMGN
ncbi:MAG: choice-of-anchor J domain-containing protein [Candidatus Promineifilaceae bacterium]